MRGPDGNGLDQLSAWQTSGSPAHFAGAFPFPRASLNTFTATRFAGLETAIEICATLSRSTGGKRSETDRKSGEVTAGLMLLLGLCGWIVDGEAGAKRALADGLADNGCAALRPEDICKRFAARPLDTREAPGLRESLHNLCRRASVAQVPDIYVLPSDTSMNAYALGQRDRAVIVLTEGLLRGMTPNEVSAILAHEIAHIANDDGWTLTQANALRRTVDHIAANLKWSANRQSRCAAPNLAWLVQWAPAIAELLCLGLSRLREFAADALALRLVPDASALTSALEKLETHYRFANAIPLGYAEDRLSSYLRSHPETWARVGQLRATQSYAC